MSRRQIALRHGHLGAVYIVNVEVCTTDCPCRIPVHKVEFRLVVGGRNSDFESGLSILARCKLENCVRS